jgi:hypothetical protein
MIRQRIVALLICAFALSGMFTTSAQGQALFNPEAVSDEIDSLNDAGLPITHMFFFLQFGLNKAASDRLNSYRVMTRQEWNKLTSEQQSTKMAELKKENPNVFVCFPAGDIYSITNERFITFLYKISDWPEDFLNYGEEEDFYEARAKRLQAPTPPKPETPQSRGGGQAAEGEHHN